MQSCGISACKTCLRIMKNKIFWVTKSPKKTNTELEKVGKSERSPMGNLACLFWRPCGCKVRESRSPTVDTATSADSGFDEAAAPKENSFLPNLVSALRDQIQWKRHVVSKRSSANLPCRPILPMTTDVLAADTGPEGGVRCLDVDQIPYYSYCHPSQPVNTKPIAGVQDWRKNHHKAFGLSQSLYDIDPETNKPVGEPNADAFAVVARENNAFLALADGCGWGVNSFLAARIAVKGCIEHLSTHLHKANTTQDITETMLMSFKHAHECILDSTGTITTLCAAVVSKIQGINCYGLSVVNVGDSLAFVYRKDGYVQEVTVGSHDVGITRDMKQAGGCIGPLVGNDPDLSNLTCSFTFVEEGDIVFLTSDGITDNFDPKVLKMQSPSEMDQLLTVQPVIQPSKSQESLGKSEVEEKASLKRDRSNSAPVNREEHSPCLPYMKKVIQSESPCGEESSAKELCAKLMNFVLQNTRERRTFLERSRDYKKEDFERMKKTIPGKLDHATVVAYEVGNFQPQPLKLTFHEKNRPKRQESSGDEKTTEPTLDQNPELMSLLGLGLLK